MSIPPGTADSSMAPIPAHSVRVSARARRIRLRVLPGKGLEVVLPQNVDPACVPMLLARHRLWIEKHLRRVPERTLRRDAGCAVPESILLKGGMETVHIRRVFPTGTPRIETCPSSEESPGNSRPSRLSPPSSHRNLLLEEDLPERLLCRLREWIREEARLHLGNMLRILAENHGFSYSGFAVRFQRSRWGSCSAKGGISLNACLLFLPERLARYILLHELCHTRQLNHSQAFWKQLFAVEPDALALDKAMRHAWSHVPAWIFI
ncbi:MAG: M48 family metallopeptidase [Desulfovibrio sp.]|nr:M48 family metallopeptidase [Desulfovibrio sp.]